MGEEVAGSRNKVHGKWVTAVQEHLTLYLVVHLVCEWRHWKPLNNTSTIDMITTLQDYGTHLLLTWNSCEDFTHAHQRVLWNLPPNGVVLYHWVHYTTGSVVHTTTNKEAVCHCSFYMTSCSISNTNRNPNKLTLVSDFFFRQRGCHLGVNWNL